MEFLRKLFTRRYDYSDWWKTRHCRACGQEHKYQSDAPYEENAMNGWWVVKPVKKPGCKCNQDANLAGGPDFKITGRR